MPKNTNGLKVTILEGKTTANKKDYFFSSQQDYIVFGCDAESCHVVFDDEVSHTDIGSEHLGLRRSLGRYQLDLNTDYYVAVDGVTAYEEQELSGKVELTLGDSVRIQIEVIDHRKQAKSDTKAHVHHAEISKTNRNAVIALAAIILTIVFVSLYAFDNTEKNINDVMVDIDSIKLKDESISTEVINKIKQSVYVVLKQNNAGGESLQGTAWVTDNGKMATNAHVAKLFKSKKADEKLLVRSSVPPYQTHEVTSIDIHPGYELFKKMWKEYLPVQKGLLSFEVMNTISPADVALMQVTNPEKLASPLSIASAHQLSALQVGTPVAFVGYPAENLLPGTLKQPVPVAQQDELVRLTDFFMTDREDGNNRLIQHGLPLIGGASGSPLFTENGSIIGIISAVNATSIRSGRISNPADINFAQRIDFLQDLTKHNKTEIIVDYVKQWQQDLTKFNRGVNSSLDAVNANIVSVLSPAMLPDETQLTGSIQNVLPKLKLVGDTRKISLPYAGLHLVTIASPAHRFGLMFNQNNKSFPHYNYPIPYSNLVYYHILVTDQSEKLNLNIFSQFKSDLDEPTPYDLNIKSWPLDPDTTREQLAIHKAKIRMSTKLSPQLLSQLEFAINEPMNAEKKDKGYLKTIPIDFKSPGFYLILTQYKQGNKFQSALKDDENVLATGKSTPQLGTLFYHHKSNETALNYLVFNKVPLNDISMRVYYWADEES